METKESLDDLVLEWRTAPKLTQRQRAELEHKIYMLLERPSRKEAKTDAATLVSKHLKVPVHELDARRRLLIAGEEALDLWVPLDAGALTHNNAVDILRRARRGPTKDVAANVRAYLAFLEEHAAKPGNVRYQGGKRVIMRMPDELPVAKAKPAVPLPRSFFKDVRDVATAHVKAHVADLPEGVQETVLRAFSSQLQVLLEDTQGAIQRHRKAERVVAETMPQRPITDIKDACTSLGVNFRVQKGVVHFDRGEAAKKFRSLAAQFHPDHVGNDPDMAKQYQAINEAWTTLKEYEHGT